MKTETPPTCVVQAFRYGDTNAGNYLVIATTDKATALSRAEDHRDYRGGKYGIAVMMDTGARVFEDDGESNKFERVAYFCSCFGEAEPSHNHRIDAFERFGVSLDLRADELPEWIQEIRKQAFRFADHMEAKKASVTPTPTPAEQP